MLILFANNAYKKMATLSFIFRLLILSLLSKNMKIIYIIAIFSYSNPLAVIKADFTRKR